MNAEEKHEKHENSSLRGFFECYNELSEKKKKQQEKNHLKLHFSVPYVEMALPLLDKLFDVQSARKSVPLLFPVETSYSQEDIAQFLVEEEDGCLSSYGKDKNRTPWSYLELNEGEDPLITYPSHPLIEKINGTPSEVLRGVNLTAEEDRALSILAHYSDRTFLQGGSTGSFIQMFNYFLKYLAVNPNQLPFLGLTAANPYSSFGKTQRNIVLKLNTAQGSRLFFKNKVIFSPYHPPDSLTSPEALSPSIIQILCTRELTLQENGGFSYKVVHFEVSVQKAFWKALVKESYQRLNNLNTWTDEIIVTFVPLIQDPGFAAAFKKKLESLALTQAQAELLADCYQRCFGESLDPDLKLSFWEQHKRKILLPVVLSSSASLILLLTWLIFASHLVLWPLIAGVSGLATLGFLTGWSFDKKYIRAYLQSQKSIQDNLKLIIFNNIPENLPRRNSEIPLSDHFDPLPSEKLQEHKEEVPQSSAHNSRLNSSWLRLPPNPGKVPKNFPRRNSKIPLSGHFDALPSEKLQEYKEEVPQSSAHNSRRNSSWLRPPPSPGKVPKESSGSEEEFEHGPDSEDEALALEMVAGKLLHRFSSSSTSSPAIGPAETPAATPDSNRRVLKPDEDDTSSTPIPASRALPLHNFSALTPNK